MSDIKESSYSSLKLISSDDYLKIFEKKLPKTEITKSQSKKPIKFESNEDKVQQKIIAEHFSEHYLDIGGWNPKNYIDVTDISDKKLTYNHYISIPIQKFEFKSAKIEEKHEENEKIIPDEKIDTKIEPIKVIESYEPEENPSINPKAKTLIEKMNNFDEEKDENLRLAKLQAKNNRVYSMVNQLLKKSSNVNRIINRKIKFK